LVYSETTALKWLFFKKKPPLAELQRPRKLLNRSRTASEVIASGAFEPSATGISAYCAISQLRSLATHIFFQLSPSDATQIAQALDGGKSLAERLENLPSGHFVVKSGADHWRKGCTSTGSPGQLPLADNTIKLLMKKLIENK
jgi:hypothetical protein